MSYNKRIEHIRELTITSLAMGGDGVAKDGGYTIFVPSAVPGDEVKVNLIFQKKNYAKAEIVEILKPSPERVKPRCPHAFECGGCQWQQIAYPAQLKYKTQIVKDLIQRVARLDPALVKPAIGMEEPWFYRNKMQYPVQKSQLPIPKFKMGFYQRGSHDVVDIQECYVQHPDLTKLGLIMKQVVEEQKIPIYDEDKGRGLLRHVIGRIGFNTREILLGLVVNGDSIPGADQLVVKIMSRAKEAGLNLIGIVQNFNTRQTNVILGERTKKIFGHAAFDDTLGGLQFRISLPSFFQTNPIQTETLYNLVKDFAELSGEEIVLDAYAGIAAIALWLSKHAKEVYCIEEVNNAVDNAMQNIEINKIENCYFGKGSVERILPEFLKREIKPDVAILDPPREGCSPQALSQIIKANPKRIVYVSCSPDTLARDLKILTEAKYKVLEIQPVDMFPHTYHVECVVKLGRGF